MRGRRPLTLSLSPSTGEGTSSPMLNHDDILARLLAFQRIVRDTAPPSGAIRAVRTSTATPPPTRFIRSIRVEPILEDFCREWAKTTPLVLIAEGLENEHGEEGDEGFPEGASEEDARDPPDRRSDRRHARHHVRQAAGVGAGRRRAEQGAGHTAARHRSGGDDRTADEQDGLRGRAVGDQRAGRARRARRSANGDDDAADGCAVRRPRRSTMASRPSAISSPARKCWPAN